MKKLSLALMALATVGCDTNDNDMTIVNIIIPNIDTMTNSCELEADLTTGHAGALNLDTGGWLSLIAYFTVQNNFAAITSDFKTASAGEEVAVTKRAEITPLRFAARYECDTSAYSGAVVNGLILPRFDPKNSFCVDDRSDARAIDENSDILPSAGAAIAAGGIGVASVRVVPHELGRAIDELWDIGVFADKCCRATECQGDLSDGNCKALQNIFDSVDGTGALSAASTAPAQNLTLRRFADYALYDGNYITQVGVEERFNKLTTPAFTMYLRGQLEGVTGYGEIVQSNDYSVQIDACRNCGFPDGTGGHGPKGEFDCIKQ